MLFNIQILLDGDQGKIIRPHCLGNREHSNAPCPIVLGIDEHSFSRKHKVFDITKGRSEPDLASYLNALPGKEWERVVCMDLSTTYCSIVKNTSPMHE